SYPPVAASIGEAEGKGGPEVSPLLSADAAAKDGDAFVLPALSDDGPQVLPGLGADKAFDGFDDLPLGLTDRLFLGLEARMAHHDAWTWTLDHDGLVPVRDGHDWVF
ncbi:hypothetical protein, partial [Brevundimonas sp. Root1279]|uniref:hypothetical protein n=1 Tax=Brevundimonas sp. Root1279 TaxID=1736443 RepID=UPI000AE7AA15